MADFLLAQGLRAASLRPIAAAAGLSDRMLLYYFPDKEAVIAAALFRAAERLATLLVPGDQAALQRAPDLQAALLAVTASEAMQPFMALWLEIAAYAARGEPLYRRVAGAIVAGFQQWIASNLDAPETDRPALSRSLLVAIEGEAVLRGFAEERLD